MQRVDVDGAVVASCALNRGDGVTVHLLERFVRTDVEEHGSLPVCGEPEAERVVVREITAADSCTDQVRKQAPHDEHDVLVARLDEPRHVVHLGRLHIERHSVKRPPLSDHRVVVIGREHVGVERTKLDAEEKTHHATSVLECVA